MTPLQELLNRTSFACKQLCFMQQKCRPVPQIRDRGHRTIQARPSFWLRFSAGFAANAQ